VSQALHDRRLTISAARVQGLEKDLGMKGNQFNIAISVLFVGYILGQLPSNYILSRTRPSIYLSVWVCIWGLISGCTAAATTFPHLVVIRFFLGFAESPYFPGALFLLSSWYTKKELAFRMAFLWSGSLLSGAFSGFISAGIQASMDGAKGLESWRWMFLIEGAVTVVFGFAALFVLPDYPST
jgi:MFS family permease